MAHDMEISPALGVCKRQCVSGHDFNSQLVYTQRLTTGHAPIIEGKAGVSIREMSDLRQPSVPV